MMYDGTLDAIEMIPYLSAILGAEDIGARGRPPLIYERTKLGLLRYSK